MRVGKLALIPVLLFTACTDEPVAPEGQDAGLIQAAKGGNKGKPGDGGDGDSFNYTITDLGVGVVGDISEGGRMVGTINGQNVVWDSNDTLVVPDPAPDGSSMFGFGAFSINAIGTMVVGAMSDAAFVQTAVRWDINGQTITATVLQPLPGLGHTASNASGVNDLGQVVGLSEPDDSESQRAVLWQLDGTPSDLGELPGHSGSLARAINNAGHIVGRSGLGATGEPHAVLWMLQEDGEVTILDLTPNSDHSGDNHAQDVTDLALDGTIQIAGYTSIARDKRPTVWTVDVQNRQVTDVRRLEELAVAGSSINEVGEVALSSAAVWNPVLNLVELLPTLSKQCSSQGGARGINNLGTVVGQSSVFAKGRCERHAVVWTKKP